MDIDIDFTTTGLTPFAVTGKTKDGRRIVIRSKEPIFANAFYGSVKANISVSKDDEDEDEDGE